MMTQDECLASPYHYVHENICYPGSVAYIGLSSANNPQPATFSVTSVPEPSTSALFAVALIRGVVFLHNRPRSAR